MGPLHFKVPKSLCYLYSFNIYLKIQQLKNTQNSGRDLTGSSLSLSLAKLESVLAKEL